MADQSHPFVVKQAEMKAAGATMDGQWMMNNCKRNIIIHTLAANGGECTYDIMFKVSDEVHCDILAAALGSVKREKAIMNNNYYSCDAAVILFAGGGEEGPQHQP